MAVDTRKKSLPALTITTRSSSRRQSREEPVSKKRQQAEIEVAEKQPKAKKLRTEEFVISDAEYDEDEEEEDLEEELPQFEYEHKAFDTDEEDLSDGCEVDLVSGCRLDTLAQNPDISLFDEEADSVDEIKSVVQPQTLEQSRWPIDQQDDSTSFSILVKKNSPAPKTKVLSASAEEKSTSATPEPQTPEDSPSSIDDFVIYNEDDGTDAAVSEEITKPTTTVPLNGYRDRRALEFDNAVTTPNTNRLLAAFSSISTDVNQPLSMSRALYQQAVIAATGLNRRSLFSGKAREMVGSGVVFNDFFA